MAQLEGFSDTRFLEIHDIIDAGDASSSTFFSLQFLNCISYCVLFFIYAALKGCKGEASVQRHVFPKTPQPFEIAMRNCDDGFAR
jgi:hypothetical protein